MNKFYYISLLKKQVEFFDDIFFFWCNVYFVSMEAYKKNCELFFDNNNNNNL